MTRNGALALMIGGLAAALVLFKLQGSRAFQYAPAWHGLIRDGYATTAALLVALLGLFLLLRR